jgi:hypothetical protein
MGEHPLLVAAFSACAGGTRAASSAGKSAPAIEISTPARK